MLPNYLSYHLPVLIRLRPFVVLLGLYFFAAFASVFVARTILGEITINGASATELGLIQKHTLLQTETWVVLWFNFLIGISLMIAIAAEQQAGMVRMQIMSGLSRHSYGARIIALGLTLGILCNFIVSVGLGASALDLWQSTPGDLLWKIFVGQGVFCAVYVLFALFCITLLIRALPAAVAFVLIPMMGEPLLVWILERNSGIELGQWFPFSAASMLVPLPYQLSAGAPPPTPLPILPVLVCLGYSVIMVFGILTLLQRRDL